MTPADLETEVEETVRGMSFSYTVRAFFDFLIARGWTPPSPDVSDTPEPQWVDSTGALNVPTPHGDPLPDQRHKLPATPEGGQPTQTCGRCGLSLDTRHEGGRCWVQEHGEAASAWVAGMRADGLLGALHVVATDTDDELLARADGSLTPLLAASNSPGGVGYINKLAAKRAAELIADLASALRHQIGQVKRRDILIRHLRSKAAEARSHGEVLARTTTEYQPPIAPDVRPTSLVHAYVKAEPGTEVLVVRATADQEETDGPAQA